jgi:hypothetical protein
VHSASDSSIAKRGNEASWNEVSWFTAREVWPRPHGAQAPPGANRPGVPWERTLPVCP